MATVWAWIQIAFAAVGGFLGWAIGGLDGFVYALVAFVVIDYVTGIMCAVVEKKLSSAIGFRGIFKKITILAMVAVGHMVDTHILGPTGYVGDYAAVRTAVIFFYITNEGLSMLENASRLGLPIPERLRKALAMFHGKEGDGRKGEAQ